MEKLRDKHLEDLSSLKETILENYKQPKRTKEMIDLEKQIEVLVSVNKLAEAEKVKEIADMQIELEEQKFSEELSGVIS